MDCRDVQNLLNAHFDGELDLIRQLQMEHHLAECTSCADRLLALKQLRNAIASAPLYHSAPDALRTRIGLVAEPAPVPLSRHRRGGTYSLAATAAGIVLLAGALTTGLVAARSAIVTENRLVEQVVAGHVRSLQVNHLMDVADTDRHTVKPWFKGQLDYSPQVPDLAEHGYPLSGGRLDYLADRSVAALVYHRRKHTINVFTWPATSTEEQPTRSISRQGYQVSYWQRSGMAYWVISDLNARELDEFVRLVQECVAAVP